MEVTVTITRSKGKTRTYQLAKVGESKKGTYALFSPADKCPDMPSFGKLYVNVTPAKPVNGEPVANNGK